MTNIHETPLSAETWRQIDHLVTRVARQAGYTDGEEKWQDYLQRKIEQEAAKAQNKLKAKARKFDRKAESHDAHRDSPTGDLMRDAASAMRHTAHLIENQVPQAVRDSRYSTMRPGRAAGVDQDFAEEIRTYLADSIRDRMADGLSEAEALKQASSQFDDAEDAPDFTAFLDEFDGFGIGILNPQAEAAKVEAANIKATTETQLWYAKNGQVVGLFYAAFLVFGLTLGALLGYIIGHNWIGAVIGLAAGFGFGIAGGLLSNAILVAKRGNRS